MVQAALGGKRAHARTENLHGLRPICLDGLVGSSQMTGLRAGMYAAADALIVRRAASGGFSVSQSCVPT